MMRLTVFMGVVGVMVASLLLALVAYRSSRLQPSGARSRIHVVLIGASIGQAWELAAWPFRVRAPEFSAESVPVWQFDKGTAIDEILMRPSTRFRLSPNYLKSLIDPPRKPGIVILKECSSYFPGDLAAYEDSVRTWVRELLGHDMRVVLATVVPVTRARASRDPGKQESLLSYNHWVRQYAQAQGLPLVDLEASLRTGEEGAYLRNDFAAEDGSHLSAAAYAVLDRTLLAAVCATTAVCSAK